MTLASTAASSIAIPAPCAAKGSIACTASPSRPIAPLLHCLLTGTVNSAHLRQSRPARGAENRLQFEPVAGNAPAGPVPGPRHDRNDVDPPRARDRVGHQMGVWPHPELHPRRGIF